MASNYKMEVDQGSDYRIKLTTGSDITGHVFTGHIRKTTSDSAILGQFSFEVIDAATGELYIKLPGSISSLIPMPKQSGPQRVKASYCYDIESQVGGSLPHRWIEGIIEINPEVTK